MSGVLDAVEETFIWGLFDRAPLARWSVGRVTLLGDACHPMLPFVAQGAAQAMEDGVTLSACLQKYDDLPEALSRYQALRLPRTAHVPSLAANNKIRFHFPDGPEQVARDAKMAAGEAAPIGRSRRWNGFTATIRQPQSKPEVLGYRPRPSLSRSSLDRIAMSALSPKADTCSATRNVRFGS